MDGSNLIDAIQLYFTNGVRHRPRVQPALRTLRGTLHGHCWRPASWQCAALAVSSFQLSPAALQCA